ncbi:MAG: leucine-rich repeat protein [Opitutales bacterium]
MKIKTIYYLLIFYYSLSLSAIKIQPIGEFEEPIKVYSLAQLKALANFNENKVKKITTNPFPIKTTKDVSNFSQLCPNWSVWTVFSDEEFYEGNCGWLHYTPFIKKINFEIPIIVWQPLEKTQKPYLTFNIPIFEGLQFDDRAAIDIPKDIKVHTKQLAFLNENNLFYFLKQGHSCDSLLLLASDWINTLINRNRQLHLPQNLSKTTQSLQIPLLTLGNGCFQNHPTLQKVILEGVKYLQDDNFSNCFNLTEVIADDLEEIGANCFCNCPNLKKLHLKNLRIIGDFCFTSFCSQPNSNGLLEITVGNEEGFIALNQLLETTLDNLQRPVAVYLEN